jgi:hypothetical protein
MVQDMVKVMVRVRTMLTVADVRAAPATMLMVMAMISTQPTLTQPTNQLLPNGTHNRTHKLDVHTLMQTQDTHQ